LVLPSPHFTPALANRRSWRRRVIGFVDWLSWAIAAGALTRL
jgi:hypothetical protein